MDLFNTLTSFQAMQPSKPRDSKPPKWFIEFVEQKFDPLVKRIDRIELRLDKIEVRLDEHEKMFKAHGWI